MDRFGYSLLPAAAEAGLGTTTLCRHIPLFRRVVGRDETTLALAPCFGPHRLLDTGLLMLRTDAHLVITRRARPLHRLRIHLHAGIGQLSGISATPRRDGVVELRFRLDGREHRFQVRPGFPADAGRLAAALGGTVTAATEAEPAPTSATTTAPAGLPRPEQHSLASYWSVQPVRHAPPPAAPPPVRPGYHLRRNH